MAVGRGSWRVLAVVVAWALVFSAVQLALFELPAGAAVHPDGVGERKAYTLEEQRLNDRLAVKVNPASGNLLVKATDLQIAGTGLDLKVERFYNSLSTVASFQSPGWLLGVGHDVKIDVASSTATFQAPSGYRAEFTQQADGTYTTADHPGLDATLTRQADGTFELEWRDKQTFVFDSAGRWTAHEDANGNRISFAYNGDGSLAQITDTRARTVSFGYTSGKLTSVSDAAGGRTYSYGYDAAGRLSSSAVTSYGLGDDKTNVGVSTLYGYDTDGRLVSITDPLTNTTQITYDGTSRKVASIVRASVALDESTTIQPTTTFTYLASLDGCASEANATTETWVDAERTDVADVTKHCFDQYDRQVAAIDAKGHKRTSEYTSNSNVTNLNESGVAAGPAFGFEWQDDRITGVTLPTGGRSAMDYTDTGNPFLPTSVRDYATADTAAPTWAYRYDDNGNLIEAANSTVGSTFRYCYNGNGTLDRIAQPPLDTVPLDEDTATSPCRGLAQGNDTIFSYNSNGELRRIRPPANRGMETFTYDALSRIATRTDARGAKQTFTYDALDRIVEIYYEPPSTGLETTTTTTTTELIPKDTEDANKTWIDYGYDANGNLLKRHDANGQDKFSYDAVNRIVREQPQSPAAVVDYTYDPAGNVTSITAADQPDPVVYTYDVTNLVDTVTDQNGRTTSFDYDDKGNPTKTAYPNGVVQESRFDDANRMRCTYGYKGTPPAASDACPSPSTSLLTFHEYSYDKVGTDTNRLETETRRDTTVTTYGYDAISRLTSATTRNSAGSTTRRHRYTYDPRGNLTREYLDGSAVSNATRTQAYDLDNSLCWYDAGTQTPDCGSAPLTATSFSYDPAGNMTARGLMDLTYSLRGHNISVTPPGSTTIDMTYADATQDRRLTVGGTRMAYDQTGLSAQGPNSGSAAELFPRTPSGRLVGMLSASTPTSDLYYLFDRLGSVVATTDTTGNLVRRYDYEPYGEQINPVAGDTNPWRYASGYYDAPTGMLKFGTRYYMPDLARWTQRDPVIGNPNDPMSLNTYAYTGCNPTNMVDPSGRHSAADYLLSCGIGAVVGALAATLGPAAIAVLALQNCATSLVVSIAFDWWGWDHSLEDDVTVFTALVTLIQAAL